MKRFVCGMLVLGLALSLAPFAAAQGGPAVTGLGGEGRALSLKLYGEFDAQMRYGNGVYVAGTSTYTTLGDPLDEADSFWGGSPKALVGLQADLADKATVLVELEVPRVNDGANVNYFGNTGSEGHLGLGIRQLYLKLDQVATPDLALTFGVQQVVSDVRGANHPLILALGRAESAFGAVAAPDEAAAGGLRADYRIGEAGMLSLFHMIVTSDGTVQGNELVTGVEGKYTLKLDDKQAIDLDALFYLNNGPADETEIWTLGLGACTRDAFVDGLSIWAQFGVNFGDAAEDIDAKGLMFNVGGQYKLAMDWNPTFGVEYLFVSGDEDATDDENGDFIAYEDNNDLAILEDKEFGWDIDTNYSVIKIRAGVAGELLPSSVKDATTLEVVLGIAKLDEEYANEDKLGTEVDIKLGWMATKQLNVYAGIAFLTGCDVIEAAGADDSSAHTFWLGTNVKF